VSGLRALRREEHAPHDRLHLDLDAGLLRSLLEDRLQLLRRRVDPCLEQQLELAAAFLADAVAAGLPAGVVEQGGGLGDVELGRRAGAAVARRVVDEVGRRGAEPAVDEVSDAPAVDQVADSAAHLRVGEDRMARLRARALAIDFGGRIGDVQVDRGRRAAAQICTRPCRPLPCA
jgi:hypothetical protein